jgi:UTP--glucose-1-phosphate uridylyltransferase
MSMNKSDAIRIFGSAAELARALNLSRGRISQLPEALDQREVDRIVGAALRLGLHGAVKPFIGKRNAAA